jgi:hypothetical protein
VAWFSKDTGDRVLKWCGLVAQLVAVLLAFVAGLSPRLWGLVAIAVALTAVAYWLAELRIDKSEQQRQPRSLTGQERQAWTDAMKRYTGTKVLFYGFAGDFESQAFGGSIIKVLQDAGLIVEPKNMMFAGSVMPDMAVLIDKSHEQDLIGEAGLCFVNLVRGKKFVCLAATIPDPALSNTPHVEPGMLHIHVGPRHFSLQPK